MKHEAAPPVAPIGTTKMNGRDFTLWPGLMATIDAALAVTRDDRDAVGRELTVSAVQLAWYAQTGTPVPESVRANHEKRAAAAVAGTAGPQVTAPTASDVPARLSGKGMIPDVRRRIAAGETDDQILAALRGKYPISPFDVRWARAHPRRGGNSR